MVRTLEVIFRRSWRLLILIVLALVVSLACTYVFAPRTYLSTTTLWALRLFDISGITNQGVAQPTTAAQTQAAALSELLHTRDFALAVAHETAVAPTLNLDQNVRSDPRLLDDALFDEISRNVAVDVLGPDLLEISYMNRDPAVARRVVLSVVLDYGIKSTGLFASADQSLSKNYEGQLAIAQKNANAAVAAESAYLQSHPNLTQNRNITPIQLLSDPNYALLDQQRVQAQTVLQKIETNIADLNQKMSSEGTSTGSLFKIIDYPQLADRAVSRLKLYITSGGIGLGVALLACTLYIVILVRRDRGVYTLSDLQKVTALPVVMQVPYLSRGHE